ncbi:NAD-dependent epimerase/dehydratase family protein [Coraliomargarita algicola]|uniref:NAD-dependent epimerase/dehydratase family protein n=1 Tax=Coraliomargarita algicola TaxID=3092156 RepID=A0ABZ0RS75_9BACT|nr:NAD-dependent epimerase/dehydratase family protein [Coraliomargarita sp. J2-16]WPJ98008.1 NAD-dependent epimerase/dehydratase family protein [Coraliomargarita sp. J2-16]
MAHFQQLPVSVIIFGCGYVGTALARHLIQQGVRVGALTRNAEQAAGLRALGLEEVIEAELDSAEWHGQVRGRYQAVVNCVSSAGGGLAGYRKSYLAGQQSILDWARSQSIGSYVYTSSTSVYPQDGGATVDESADTRAAPPTGQVLLESEALFAEAAFLPNWYVLRLAGIYGPGRHYLLDQIRDGAGEIPGRGDYALNMIHLEDIVAAICAVISGGAPAGIYNIADDGPATKAEVLTYLAKALGLSSPVFNPENVSERLKRRGGRMPHRLISNKKAREALDWRPKFPSFREGYAELL